MLLSRDQLLTIMPRLKGHPRLVASYLPKINEALEEFDIDTPARVQQFLAQLAHESAQLTYMQEIASGDDYDGREDLGNTDPEAIRIAKKNKTTPGRFYKGHGPIQLTGYYNHKKYGALLGVDFVNKPKLAATPEYGFRVAGLYWHLNRLNALADKNTEAAFKTITRKINGGTRGWADRLLFWSRAKKAIKTLGTDTDIQPLASLGEASPDRSDVADISEARPVAVSTSAALKNQDQPASEPIPEPPPTQVTIEQGGGVNIEAQAPAPENADPKNMVKVTAGSGSWVRSVLGWLGGLAAIAQEHIASVFGLTPEMQRYLFFAALGGGVLYLVLKFLAERQVRNIAADPSKASVK